MRGWPRSFSIFSPREEEVDEITRHDRFDIGMLADRLVAAVDWLGEQADTRDLPIGLFGASTGGGRRWSRLRSGRGG